MKWDSSLQAESDALNLAQDLARDAFNAERTRANLEAFWVATKALDAFNDQFGPETPIAEVEFDDYRGQHGAPTKGGGSPLHDVVLGGAYPEDFYGPSGSRYYGDGSAEDNRAMALVRAYHNRPNARITVYRAVPKSVKAGINVGDWVAVDRRYAVDHGKSALRGDYRIARKTVSARDLFTGGDSIQEWGYDPQPRVPRR